MRREVLTCPAGQQTRKQERNGRDTGRRFQFVRSQRKECPLHGQCMERLPARHGCTVVKDDYQAEFDWLKVQVQTGQYGDFRY